MAITVNYQYNCQLFMLPLEAVVTVSGTSSNTTSRSTPVKGTVTRKHGDSVPRTGSSGGYIAGMSRSYQTVYVLPESKQYSQIVLM